MAGPQCAVAEKPREGVHVDGWLLSVLLGHLIHARDLLDVLPHAPHSLVKTAQVAFAAALVAVVTSVRFSGGAAGTGSN